MGESDNENKEINSPDYIAALDEDEIIYLFYELCKDVELAGRINEMARTYLSGVDVEKIKDSVFQSLNAIDIEDLWDNSGKTRWGYNDPTEVAYDMIGDVVNPHIEKMNQYGKLGMKEEEKEYCKGILSGLLKYGQEGSNDFSDSAPDDPYTYAEDIIYHWKENHTKEEIAEIQAVYDSFFQSDEDSVLNDETRAGWLRLHEKILVIED